jgi:lysophospholipase L1-like esterase
VQLDRLCGVPTLAAGVSGARVDEIVDFSHRIVAAADPETIVVAIGVNDTVRGFETDDAAFTASYRRLLAPWTGGRARLVLATLMPVADEGPLGREHFDPTRMARLNEIVRGLADETGLAVIPLDRLPTVASGGLRPDLTDDGVHPTPEGYRHWIAAIEGAVCPK